jgi:membrane-bound lytic murein transglycosylase D
MRVFPRSPGPSGNDPEDPALAWLYSEFRNLSEPDGSLSRRPQSAIGEGNMSEIYQFWSIIGSSKIFERKNLGIPTGYNPLPVAQIMQLPLIMLHALSFRKIFLIGIIFFLSFHGKSYVAAQDISESNGPEEVKPYPSTLLGLITQPDGQRTVSSGGRAPFVTPSPGEESSGKTLELSVSDELFLDFNPELLGDGLYRKEPKFDIPIIMNAKVEQFIQYFQTDIRERFVTYLSRSRKYIPSMRKLLKEQGLPEDLVYIALIESGFEPSAYSRSKASGPWQFISQTGKRYGLKVNWWVDERRDPEKSTIAAAKHLKDLYERFECWYLAAAGYNAGEYKIIRAMKRYRTEDFWSLANYRYLKRETKNYVPQMIAAALIAKDPEKYGFTDVEYQEPLRYEKLKIPELTGLSLIAKACETSLEEIKDLNPEILRGVTPPDDPDYEIKIPFGKKDVFLKNFESLQPVESFQFKTHSVKNGETLAGIARVYRVDLDPLLEINHLKKTSRISKGTTLLIPLSKDEQIRPLAVAKKKNGKAQSKPVKPNVSS